MHFLSQYLNNANKSDFYDGELKQQKRKGIAKPANPYQTIQAARTNQAPIRSHSMHLRNPHRIIPPSQNLELSVSDLSIEYSTFIYEAINNTE